MEGKNKGKMTMTNDHDKFYCDGIIVHCIVWCDQKHDNVTAARKCTFDLDLFKMYIIIIHKFL